jgi:hypothetical protein
MFMEDRKAENKRMRITILSLAAVCMLLVAGCGNKARVSGNEDSIAKDKSVEVIVAGNGKFPEFLVGTWKNKSYNWEFVFERDGTISSAAIDSGFMHVIPSRGIATKPMREGGTAVYKLGKWLVEYEPSTRELAVEVVVDHFRVDMKPNWLEGSSTDWFVGPVSEDGQSWSAMWSSFPKNIACTPDCQELPVDYNNTTLPIVFTKEEPKISK